MADDNIRNAAMSFLLKDESLSPKETPSYTLYEDKEDNSQENKKDLLIEKLADYAHEAWSGWMKYLFEKSSSSEDGSVTIPKELVDRWTRQLETPYEDLSEEEKASDRKEAYKMLNIVKGINTNNVVENTVHKVSGGLNEVIDTELPDLSDAFEQVLENKTKSCIEDIEKVRERFTSNIREDIMKDMFR